MVQSRLGGMALNLKLSLCFLNVLSISVQYSIKVSILGSFRRKIS